MYPSEFDYERAETVDHALELLSGDPEAKIISGGHSLIPMMKSGLANPGTLVDIGEIDELTGIEWDDDTVSVGALTTYATIADDDELWDELPVLAEAAHEVGDIQVRNRGTIGGNVAHGDPASDLPAAVLAADATVVVQGPDGERRIDVDDFFLGMYATELGEDEILTGLEFPRSENATTTGAYVKKPSPSSGYALVGVAVSLEVDDGRIESARVAANGIMDHGVRLEPVEDGLVGEPRRRLLRRRRSGRRRRSRGVHDDGRHPGLRRVPRPASESLHRGGTERRGGSTRRVAPDCLNAVSVCLTASW